MYQPHDDRQPVHAHQFLCHTHAVAIHCCVQHPLPVTTPAAAGLLKGARELWISQVEADLLPEAKLARIKGLVKSGCVVAMVSDGINRAPALTEASVGVAMGSGTDVARESADDVVLLGNDLITAHDFFSMTPFARSLLGNSRAVA